MVVHGSGAGHETLSSAVIGRNVAMVFDDDMHDLSLQGPAAVEFLAKHVPGIRDLKYFHHMPAQLFGRPVHISRTGYTGERGYEIFCKGEDAGLIWDTILAEGKSFGIIPTCFSTLDMLRVESYLLFYPYDMSQMYPFEKDPPGDSLWELGLDFTVSPGKTDFRGADQHYRLKGKERFRIFGLLVDGDVPADMGDGVYASGKTGWRRDLRHVFDAHEEVDGHCPPGVAVRGTGHAPGNPWEACQRGGDGAYSAVRRSG